jgi:predicted ATPase/DNA-binding SARP family transcriptional activator/Tfp pilus assembly protein PilF
MTKLSIRLLGPLQVTLDGQPLTDFATDKARALLAYLAVESDHSQRRDTLAGLLWPEHPQRQARQSLRQTLVRLRQALGDDQERGEPFLLSDRETVQFNSGSDHWLDVASFTVLTQDCKGHRHRRPGLCLLCLRRMARAVELYQGDFLAQFFLRDSEAFEEWATLTREWLRREAVEALAHLARYHERRGDYAQARAYARRQVELEPWREESHRHLMRLLALDGQRSAALAQYQMCCQTLAQDLAVEPADETTALYERIQAGEDLDSAAPLHNLPASPAPFVGRETELAHLAGRLADPACRLLTIVGPGGIGKTRLALQAAADQIGIFAHGVAFVSLASVNSPDLLAPAIAGALGFSLQGQDPREQLVNRLRDREMLLVLDGMEHLVGDVGLLVDTLRRAPDVILLVTSRERLSLQEEWVYVLEGLTCPQGTSWSDEKPEAFSAVELFRQRATQADQRFSLTKDTAPHVVRICQLVEGMPLGVELAAAWAATRSCEEMAQAIERNLDALTTPLRNVPQRQRSVRATFDHSWSLLSGDECRVFEGLSVFRGGFSGAAAAQVVGASPGQLAALLNKSLLRKDGSGRYAVHELLRQFAAEKLHVSEQEAQLRDKHCRYYAQFLHQREDALQKREDQAIPDQVAREIGNVRAAWDWAVARARWDEVGKSLKGVWLFYLIRGPLQVGGELLQAAETRLREWLAGQEGEGQKEVLVLARLLVAQAHLHNRQALYDRAAEMGQAAAELARQAGDAGVEAQASVEWAESHCRRGAYEGARRLLEQALAQARIAQRSDVEAEALRQTGNTFLHVGDFDQARSYYEQALRICCESGDRPGEGAALYNIGCILTHLGRHAEARAHFEQDLAVYRDIGDQLNEAMVFNNLAEVVRLSGDPDGARFYYEQALQRFHESGAREGKAITLHNLGMFLGTLGDDERARAYCERSLDIRRQSGDQKGEAIVLAGLGLLALQRGNAEAALTYCQQALGIAEELGDRLRQSRTLTRMGHA